MATCSQLELRSGQAKLSGSSPSSPQREHATELASPSSSVHGTSSFGTDFDPRIHQGHPMSTTRLRMGLPPSGGGLKSIWELRKRAQIPIETGASETHKVPERKTASEFTSLAIMKDQQRRHARSFSAPSDRFNMGTTTAHEVGWHISTPETSFLCRQMPSKHAVLQSSQTNFRHKTLMNHAQANLPNRR